MEDCNVPSTRSGATLFVLLLGLLLFPAVLHAQLFVDCSGTNPNEFPSIAAALQQASTVGFALQRGWAVRTGADPVDVGE